MRKRWTTWLATSALVLLVGSGITAVHAGAADAGQKDFPFPYKEKDKGFTGWRIKEESRDVTGSGQVTADCPDRKRVTGGGANVTGPNPILVGSFPSSDGKSWIGAGRTTTPNATIRITVWAVCAKVS